MSLVCELCRHEGAKEPFYPTHEIVRCPDCRLVFYGRDVDNVESLYSDDYFKGGEYLDYVEDKRIIQANFARRVADLKRLKPSGKLLEIGSAYGFFLDLAREHWDVKGMDITPEGVRHAREVLGLDVVQADFLEQPDEPSAYDVIVMWDTIEHLPHPVRVLEKAARWLAPGGVLVATTGDVGSAVARMRKEKWRLIHPPTHLYYFSTATLSDAMTRSGLTVEQTTHVGYDRSLKGMLYGMMALGDKPLKGVYEAVTKRVDLDVPVYLNFFDIMMVAARKPA
jgi:2-polyprenyl-3-methyl-5-hydroxy-6-metoxy-1,4-benzoquinol methylase